MKAHPTWKPGVEFFVGNEEEATQFKGIRTLFSRRIQLKPEEYDAVRSYMHHNRIAHIYLGANEGEAFKPEALHYIDQQFLNKDFRVTLDIEMKDFLMFDTKFEMIFDNAITRLAHKEWFALILRAPKKLATFFRVESDNGVYVFPNEINQQRLPSTVDFFTSWTKYGKDKAVVIE